MTMTIISNNQDLKVSELLSVDSNKTSHKTSLFQKLSLENSTLDLFTLLKLPLSGLNPLVGFKRIFSCIKCNRMFRTEKQVTDHIKMYHPRLKCPEHHFKIVSVDGEYIEKKLKECRSKVMVFECDNGHKKFVPNSCFLRVCLECEDIRKSRYLKRYSKFIKSFKRVSLLTLTIKGQYNLDKKTKEGFEYQVKKFFKMMKYRFKYNYKKIRVLHIKSKGSGEYYYHFHFLIDMPYISQKRCVKEGHVKDEDGVCKICQKLSVMWKKATKGESFVVDIRYVENRWSDKQKLGYICKYLAKPFDNINEEEYALHMYRSRFAECRVDKGTVKGLIAQAQLVISSVMEQKYFNSTCEKCGSRFFYDKTISREEFCDEYG